MGNMKPDLPKRPPDPFGDDEGVLDIECRPALQPDLAQIAVLAVNLLDKVFGEIIGKAEMQTPDTLKPALQVRLRNDCTWVMNEGEIVIGMIDLETTETRRINGPPIPRILTDLLGYTTKVREVGLMPLLEHRPEPDEAHQTLVALLPGSRGEGRGTLLLMHGAFWARAQGKNWLTTWLPADEPFLPVYKRRGYFIEQETEIKTPNGVQKWLFLKKPISSYAHKVLRQKKLEK
jgi:GNAT superfamily N-acetyltransferase